MTPMPTTTAVLFPGQGSHSEGMDAPFRSPPAARARDRAARLRPLRRPRRGDTLPPAGALSLLDRPVGVARGPRRRSARRGRPLARRVRGADRRRRDRLRGRGPARRTPAPTRWRTPPQLEPGGMVAHARRRARRRARARRAELGLSLANDNAPGQIVLSGRMDAVDQAVERAEQIGCRAPQARRRRRVPLAAHGARRRGAAARARRRPRSTSPRSPCSPTAARSPSPTCAPSSPRTSSSRSAGARRCSSSTAWA